MYQADLKKISLRWSLESVSKICQSTSEKLHFCEKVFQFGQNNWSKSGSVVILRVARRFALINARTNIILHTWPSANSWGRRRRERNRTQLGVLFIGFRSIAVERAEEKNGRVPGHLLECPSKAFGETCPLTRRINYPFHSFFPFLSTGKCENLLRQVQNNDMQSNLRTRT